jgi:dinuclear metal center YbgI/SA1388 family protein
VKLYVFCGEVKAMTLEAFIAQIEAILPPSTAMKGDRIGLQVQSGRIEFSSLFITMEITESVAHEAIARGAECILTFHPLLFVPTTAITEYDRVGRIVTLLVQHRIAVVVAHTNFDAFPRGTSTLFAEQLGLSVRSILVPDTLHAGFGIGVVCESNEAYALPVLVERITALTHAPVRYTEGIADTSIRRIVIVGGSGISFMDDALRVRADVFITADVKYHDFHRVHGRMALIDAGHYEMESFVVQGLLAVVRQMQEQPASVMLAQTIPNPVRYGSAQFSE